MVTCTRRVQFCSGHRVFQHESKCAHLHGHNYVAMVECVGGLDPVGRVIDFGVIKHEIGEWIENNWDHRFLVYEHDPMAPELRRIDPAGTKIVPFNPTAENMAQALLDIANVMLGPFGVRVISVKLWETENCYVEARV